MKLYFRTPVDQSFVKVKSRFDKSLFLYLKPPGMPLTIERFDGCRKGDEIHLKLAAGMKWVSLVTSDSESQKEWSFVDEGKLLPWPLTYWRHQHRVLNENDKAVIVDEIEYHCRNKVLEKAAYPIMLGMFGIRPAMYKKYFKE